MELLQDNKISDDLMQISNVLEKPSTKETKLDMVIICRYVLNNMIFYEIEVQKDNEKYDFTKAILNIK